MLVFRFCSKRLLFNFFLCCVSRERIWVQLQLYKSFIFLQVWSNNISIYIYIFLKKSFSFPFSTASGWGMQCWEKRRCWEKESWVLMKARLKGSVEKIPCLTAQLLCYRRCPRASQPHRGNTLCKHTLGSDSKSIISTSCLWQHLTAVSLLSASCPLDPRGYHKLSAKLCPTFPLPQSYSHCYHTAFLWLEAREKLLPHV